jgi:hypothetical protein
VNNSRYHALQHALSRGYAAIAALLCGVLAFWGLLNSELLLTDAFLLVESFALALPFQSFSWTLFGCITIPYAISAVALYVHADLSRVLVYLFFVSQLFTVLGVCYLGEAAALVIKRRTLRAFLARSDTKRVPAKFISSLMLFFAYLVFATTVLLTSYLGSLVFALQLPLKLAWAMAAALTIMGQLSVRLDPELWTLLRITLTHLGLRRKGAVLDVEERSRIEAGISRPPIFRRRHALSLAAYFAVLATTFGTYIYQRSLPAPKIPADATELVQNIVSVTSMRLDIPRVRVTMDTALGDDDLDKVECVMDIETATGLHLQKGKEIDIQNVRDAVLAFYPLWKSRMQNQGHPGK